MKVPFGWIVVCLSAGVFGQTVPALQCVANAGVPPALRAEGLTELTGDIVLQCTGGTPTPAGQILPPVNIQIFLNPAFTSRLLPNGLSEALLLMDEPGPSAQSACTSPPCSIAAPGNPEAVGNPVVLYGGGAGQTMPPGRDGALAGVGGPLATLNLPVKVFIDGIAATNIPYAGPAPGIVEGVFQIDVQIPAAVRHNANVPVVVQIEDKQTQPGVTLATK